MANLETVSSLPTISLNALGRYFSIHGTARGFFGGLVVSFFSGSISIAIAWNRRQSGSNGRKTMDEGPTNKNEREDENMFVFVRSFFACLLVACLPPNAHIGDNFSLNLLFASLS